MGPSSFEPLPFRPKIANNGTNIGLIFQVAAEQKTTDIEHNHTECYSVEIDPGKITAKIPQALSAKAAAYRVGFTIGEKTK